jgi:hypothetical protein
MLTIKDYVFCAGMFLLGQLIHIFWIKIPAYKIRATAANKPFSYSEWWSCDSTLIIGLNLVGISLLVGVDQLIGIWPSWIDKLKWGFWLIGTFGSSVGYKYYKGYDSGNISLLSAKANVSGAVLGDTNTVADTIEKAKEAGLDINQK